MLVLQSRDIEMIVLQGAKNRIGKCTSQGSRNVSFTRHKHRNVSFTR